MVNIISIYESKFFVISFIMPTIVITYTTSFIIKNYPWFIIPLLLILTVLFLDVKAYIKKSNLPVYEILKSISKLLNIISILIILGYFIFFI